MKATELRIGNIIDINNKIISVTIEDINRINYNTIPGYSPIPLTEEILLKVGFVKGETKNGLVFYDFLEYRIYLTGNVSFHLMDNFDYYPYLADCKHLHQLQNLYFSLTGGDLDTSRLL